MTKPGQKSKYSIHEVCQSLYLSREMASAYERRGITHVYPWQHDCIAGMY